MSEAGQTQKQIELLAPAGSWESLQAAVRCGADAVYLGGRELNARRSAENFDDLAQVARYCHARGVRVYLTLNTLVFDSEMALLRDVVKQAAAAGIDAAIVQDLAVADLVRRCAPGMELHASTQMSVHNLEGAKLLEGLGFCKVVLAREMAAEEIRRVAQGTSMQVECFVHGALCMCVSGQCTLSSMIGGRSGNRGMCAQPCRLPFAAGDATHALSLKDLSLVEHIPLLRELGVDSLKIEGRMKRPEYVACATTACRQMLAGEPVDFALLESVFSRTGFTDGYLTGQRGGVMFGTRQKEDVTAASPQVLKALQALYKNERQSVGVAFSLTVRAGIPVTLCARDGDGNRAEAAGEPPQQALTAPTTREKAQALLAKTGGTPYYLRTLEAELEDGLMVPASAMNALRRDVLAQLTAQREAVRSGGFLHQNLPGVLPRHEAAKKPALRVRLEQAVQLTPDIIKDADEIVLPLEAVLELPQAVCAKIVHKLYAELPRMQFDGTDDLKEDLQVAADIGVKGAIAGGPGGIQMALEAGLAVSGDFGLNIANSQALEQYRKLGLQDATLSFELDLQKIRALGGATRRGIIAYGYLPLMVTRNCPVKAAKGCRDCKKEGPFPLLTDRKGNRFFVSCDRQSATLHNHVPLFLADRLNELAGVDFLTLYFTRESPEQCSDMLRLYRTGGSLEGDKTRGLYYRQVL